MNATQDQCLWYGVLGPVVVLRGQDALDLGPRQRRVLLTRLLIEDGRAVSLTELRHTLWGSDQPAAAVSSIRAHISRLRSVLDPVREGRSSVLVSGPSGYALRVPRNARDTTAFEASVVRARDALGQQQLPRARSEIDAALGLWRGAALGEAAEHSFAVRESARLHAARQDAEELRTTILIRQGDLVPAVDAAEQLTIGAPLRETSWALLMRALYAAGRPVEALRQYDRFRGTLARELGLDPSPGLRDLHLAVLRHDTAVLGLPRPPRSATTLSGAQPVAGMPFAGRTEETGRLHAVLEDAAAGGTRWAVIRGEPGSGRTRLLDEFAAQAAEAGFAVTRASGGHVLDGSHGVTFRCPITQLLDGLQEQGPDTGTRDRSDEDVLTTLIREVAWAPTLCVVDDLDWATSDVYGRLCRLARLLRDVPVVIVCAVRDTECPPAGALLAELARLRTTWLQLEPLKAEDVAAILAGRGESGSSAEAQALHRRSAGNPFVLGELLKLPPRQRTGEGARVPASVRSIVQARLAERPDPVRTMLTHAAVDGGLLDIGLLTSVLGVKHERLLELVDGSVAGRLVVWRSDPGVQAGGHYLLPDMVREVLLDALSPSSRQLLHSVIARELTGRDVTDPGRLVGHLRAAGPMAPVTVPSRTAASEPEEEVHV
ncbi:BTAD domain-containing putative transcriptional regulator [Streptomyces sp. NPDC003023]|uniref:BTAD domain-containing putative transcriptional regulator n=1 Tax=Streptomyces sp. NPDC003023 TaxID=3364675 RepID=UPI0036779A15